jgi:demethylmenaquinone methyltransferase / 2-methoxy-6-polyprenyl-1,4-benzoquinol methylase
MSFRLPTAEEKASYVQKQFDRIAFRYDLANDVISFGMHRSWKEQAIEALAVKAGGSYLDVCTGTGDLALRIADRSGGGGQVVGIDFSANMLHVATARAQAKHVNSEQSDRSRAPIEWVAGDAQDLPFADDTFDGAIISFGLRNITDLQKAICEMVRVVKPGGHVVNLDLGHPQAPIFTPLYFLFFRHIVPFIGEVIQGDRAAYTYLPTSLTTYPKPDGITRIFENAYLINVSHKPLALGSVALHKGTVP